jgi:hypothetical protein
MKRTTAKLLGADCAPLLAGDSWLGRNVVSLTDALRHLDDSEIESLVRLVPDQSHHREIADSLLLLKADCERPVGEVLLDVCNQLWQRTLKASVEKTLTALAAWKSTGGSSAFQDLKLDPFKIGPTTDAVISGPNIPDFKFEPKDQEFKFDLKKKSFEKERFKIPDFRVENTSEAK